MVGNTSTMTLLTRCGTEWVRVSNVRTDCGSRTMEGDRQRENVSGRQSNGYETKLCIPPLVQQGPCWQDPETVRSLLLALVERMRLLAREGRWISGPFSLDPRATAPMSYGASDIPSCDESALSCACRDISGALDAHAFLWLQPKVYRADGCPVPMQNRYVLSHAVYKPGLIWPCVSWDHLVETVANLTVTKLEATEWVESPGVHYAVRCWMMQAVHDWWSEMNVLCERDIPVAPFARMLTWGRLAMTRTGRHKQKQAVE